MDQSTFDIMMRFVLKGGGAVWGQSTLDVHPNDDLMKGFKPVSDLEHYSNFFEVLSFDFAMTVEPEDTGTGNLSRGGAGAPQAGAGAQGASGSGTKGKGKGKDAADPWQRWRSATEAEARKLRFSLTFDSFRFTRAIDGASPTFFQQCARQQSFDSVTLVKRVSTGLVAGSQRVGMAFMRLTFKEVMLKGVKWSDGEIVTESSEFVCNGLTFEYRQQQADGRLLPVQEKAVWDRKQDSERKDQGAD